MQSIIIPMLQEEKQRILQLIDSLKEMLWDFPVGNIKRNNNRYYVDDRLIKANELPHIQKQIEERDALLKILSDRQKDAEQLSRILENRRGPKQFPQSLRSAYMRNLQSLLVQADTYEQEISLLPKGKIYEYHGHCYLKWREDRQVRSRYLGKPGSEKVLAMKQLLEKRDKMVLKYKSIKSDANWLSAQL